MDLAIPDTFDERLLALLKQVTVDRIMSSTGKASSTRSTMVPSILQLVILLCNDPQGYIGKAPKPRICGFNSLVIPLQLAAGW
jgi:hypothetical protein